MLVGTIWCCRRCGNEYKRPVVSVDRVNEVRAENAVLWAIIAALVAENTPHTQRIAGS